MKTGSKNWSTNLARNTGQSSRSPHIAKKELVKSTMVNDRAFYVNSRKMVLHKYTMVGRSCSCVKFSSPEQEMFEDDSYIDTPVIILSEEDGMEDDIALDKALEMLENPKDVCPLCYGTSVVGNYKASNCVEYFLDTTFPDKKLFGVEIKEGKPFYFYPVSSNSSIVFSFSIPSFFNSLRFSLMPKSTFKHQIMDTGMVEIGTRKGILYPFDNMDLEELAKSGKIDIRIPLIEPIVTFFIRFEVGEPTIYVNLPNIGSEIESGEHDYFSSITASVDSKLRISNRDILYDSISNLYWRITGVEKKEPMSIDVGKEVTMRKVRGFESYALIP